MSAQMIPCEIDQLLWRRVISVGEYLLVDVLAQLLHAYFVDASGRGYCRRHNLVSQKKDRTEEKTLGESCVLLASVLGGRHASSTAFLAATADLQRCWAIHLPCARCLASRTKLAAAQPLRKRPGTGLSILPLAKTRDRYHSGQTNDGDRAMGHDRCSAWWYGGHRRCATRS